MEQSQITAIKNAYTVIQAALLFTNELQENSFTKELLSHCKVVTELCSKEDATIELIVLEIKQWGERFKNDAQFAEGGISLKSFDCAQVAGGESVLTWNGNSGVSHEGLKAKQKELATLKREYLELSEDERTSDLGLILNSDIQTLTLDLRSIYKILNSHNLVKVFYKNENPIPEEHLNKLQQLLGGSGNARPVKITPCSTELTGFDKHHLEALSKKTSLIAPHFEYPPMESEGIDCDGLTEDYLKQDAETLRRWFDDSIIVEKSAKPCIECPPMEHEDFGCNVVMGTYVMGQMNYYAHVIKDLQEQYDSLTDLDKFSSFGRHTLFNMEVLTASLGRWNKSSNNMECSTNQTLCFGSDDKNSAVDDVVGNGGVNRLFLKKDSYSNVKKDQKRNAISKRNPKK